MNEAHCYDLAFLTPGSGARTVPEIVFVVHEAHLSTLTTQMLQVAGMLREHAEDYLGEVHSFHPPDADLFDNRSFGYKMCGYATEEHGNVSLRLELRPEQTQACALSILVLTMALAGMPSGSNRPQQVTLHISAGYRSGGWGHAVNGYISNQVISWLQAYASTMMERRGFFEAAPMPPPVIEAMRTAWDAVSEAADRQWRRDCSGWIGRKGNFSLNCPGNACDLSVYPDSPGLGDGLVAMLSCHNLDTAPQQLTLLAGLAKLLELVRATP